MLYLVKDYSMCDMNWCQQFNTRYEDPILITMNLKISDSSPRYNETKLCTVIANIEINDIYIRREDNYVQ